MRRELSLAICTIVDEEEVQELLAWTHVDDKKLVLQCLNEPLVERRRVRNGKTIINMEGHIEDQRRTIRRHRH